MLGGDKFNIKSGKNSHNYQAGRDINQNYGNIFQHIAQSRLAKAAAVMTILAGIIAVAQYISSLPANFKLSSVSLRYNAQFNKNDFDFVMQNQGPDNIKNLKWYAWLEGTPVTLRNVLRGGASIVARGDMYVAKHVGQGELSDNVNYQSVGKARKVNLCLVYDGPLPGTRQWMLLSAINEQSFGYSGSINSINGIWPKTVDTGGGIAFISSECSLNNG